MYVKLHEMPPEHDGVRVQVRTLDYNINLRPSSSRTRKIHIKRAWEIINSVLDQKKASGFRDHVTCIPTDELSFAASAYVVHKRLSKADLNKRAAIMEELAQDILGPVEGGHNDAKSHETIMTGVQKASFVYPTVCLEMMVRNACAEAMSRMPKGGQPMLKRRVAQIENALKDIYDPKDNARLIKAYLQPALPYMDFAELEGVADAAADILSAQGTYQPHVEELFRVFGVTWQPVFLRHRARALVEIVDKGFEDYQECLDDIFTEATEAHHKIYADMLKVAHRMIDDQLPTPQIARNQKALLQTLRGTAEAEALSIVEEVQSSHAEETEEQRELREAEAHRLVAELLAGIEEPTGTGGRKNKSKKKKPRRDAPVKQTGKGRREKTQQSKVEKETRKDPIPGLKKYLDFTVYELEGLLPRVPEGGEENEAVSAGIQAMTDEIQGLLNSGSTDCAEYEQKAHDVDSFLTTTRKSIRRLVAHADDIASFSRALDAAIGKEPVVYARRNGGVLRRGLGNIAWSTIDRQYHYRHLPNIVELVQGNVCRLLMSDEALALYVTSSSLSGYPFDISCHYWRRRPGSDAPPADEDGFMNTDHWYDTYVPCFVLHVPHDV